MAAKNSPLARLAALASCSALISSPSVRFKSLISRATLTEPTICPELPKTGTVVTWSHNLCPCWNSNSVTWFTEGSCAPKTCRSISAIHSALFFAIKASIFLPMIALLVATFTALRKALLTRMKRPLVSRKNKYSKVLSNRVCKILISLRLLNRSSPPTTGCSKV